jgi:hypothetical protein
MQACYILCRRSQIILFLFIIIIYYYYYSTRMRSLLSIWFSEIRMCSMLCVLQITPAQYATLVRMGCKHDEINDLTKMSASDRITELIEERNQRPATQAQLKLLKVRVPDCTGTSVQQVHCLHSSSSPVAAATQ